VRLKRARNHLKEYKIIKRARTRVYCSNTFFSHSSPFKKHSHMSNRFNVTVCELVYIEKSDPNPNFHHSTHFQILISTPNHGWTKTQHTQSNERRKYRPWHIGSPQHWDYTWTRQHNLRQQYPLSNNAPNKARRCHLLEPSRIPGT
jgi:hypothetical protein